MGGDASETASPVTPPRTYNVAVGHLRGGLTVLVLAVHSAVAYYGGPFPMPLLVRQMTFPVLDPHGFNGARIFALFIDIFLMSAFFFLSGLFVWPGLERKGPARFLRERLIRLGVPWIPLAGILIPIAYYPAYLQATPVGASVADYAHTWLRWENWRCGTSWFLAALLAFDVLCAGLYAVAPGVGPALARLTQGSDKKPLRLLLLLTAVSAVLYIPMALAFTPTDWWNLGPFWIQKSRSLHFVAYFLLGAGVGAYGLSHSLFAREGALARRWWTWGLAAIACFLIVGNVIRWSVSKDVVQHPFWGSLTDLGWVIDCALTTFAMIALFARFARPGRIWDSLAANAYGMYLLHYPMVSWLQYALIPAHISPQLKAVTVIAAVVAASWALTAAIRRIPGVARIV